MDGGVTRRAPVRRRRGVGRCAAIAVVVILGLAVTCACGSSTPSLQLTRAPSAVTVTVGSVAHLGQVLTNDGRTLYVFPPDHQAEVLCTGGCQGTWPPLTVRAGGRLTAGDGADQGKLDTIADPGSPDRVVTYNRWPLYRYAGDVTPGTANGQALSLNGGPWYAMRPSGEAVVFDPLESP